MVTLMHLKLAFSYDHDLFRVTTLQIGEHDARPEPIVIQYADDAVFLELLFEAEVEPITHARIVGAVAGAVTAPHADSCCVDVIFSEHQFDTLLRSAARSEISH